jgi:hypothetical protein
MFIENNFLKLRAVLIVMQSKVKIAVHNLFNKIFIIYYLYIYCIFIVYCNRIMISEVEVFKIK